MSALLFHDGKFLRDDTLLVGAGNRGLRYGDGLFETMKVNLDNIQLGEFHMQRLFSALEILSFECPAYFTPTYLLDKISQLVHRNGHSKLARIRLMIYRGNGGLYDPEHHFPHHVIQSWHLPAANQEWNENGLVLGIHRKAFKAQDILANCKTNNYLPFVMGALEAKQQKWNDAIILNANGRVCETTIANIFLVKNETIITPPLTEGPVAGTIRQYLLNKLASAGFNHNEQELTEEMIENADEVFLTNSSYGIRWVGSIGAQKYIAKLTREIYQQVINPLFLKR